MPQVGNQIFTMPPRPSAELIALFQELPVANIDDNMGRIYAVSKLIRPMNSTPLLGIAFTVKVPAGDNLLLHRALDLAGPGDILIVDGGGYTDRALCGELMFTYAQSRGISGIVVDGAIRDSGAAAKMNWPIYARGVSADGPYKNGPGEINVPVSIGGRVIFPGDILVGDEDGIIAIRPAEAAEVAEAAKQQNQREQETLRKTVECTLKKEWVCKAVEQKNCVELGVSYPGL